MRTGGLGSEFVLGLGLELGLGFCGFNLRHVVEVP